APSFFLRPQKKGRPFDKLRANGADLWLAALDQPAPNSDPIAMVRAIAQAPQKVTRVTARRIGARPIRAPSAPSSAREASDAPDTVHGSDDPESSSTTRSGSAAPIAKLAAHAAAASIGRACAASV